MDKNYYQIIIVVETTRKAKIDCRYIGEVLSYYFNDYKTASNITYQYVYMNGKFAWNSPRVKKEIMSHLSSVPNYTSYVIYVLDMDDYTVNQNDAELINLVKTFCNNFDRYYCVLFNKNIEHVLIGHIVSDKLKDRTASDFIRKRLIRNVNKEILMNPNPLSEKQSNILCVFREVHNKIDL